jgi:hypothetical protein
MPVMTSRMDTDALQRGNHLVALAMNEPGGLLARVGQTELSIWNSRLAVRPTLRSRLRLAAQAKINAGVWPPTVRTLRGFSETYASAFGRATVVASWGSSLPAELEFLDRTTPIGVPRVLLDVADPVYLSAHGIDPWTHTLDGRRVLVLAPFAELARSQSRRHSQLFAGDINPLPRVSVLPVVPPQTQGLQLSRQTWREHFESLKRQVDMCVPKVESALIAAGAYGMPIAAHLAAAGVPTAYVGGCLQLLFGIHGRRWESREYLKGLTTEKWVNQDPASRPRGAGLIEGGAYW